MTIAKATKGNDPKQMNNWVIVEPIEWHAADQPPDDGITVMLFSESPEASEPVWPGYFERDAGLFGGFFWADGSVAEGVVRWSEMPRGRNHKTD